MKELCVVAKRRRFTCLSPTLVRLEFSPTGVFEDRRSLVASNKKDPVSFTKVDQDGDVIILETDEMKITSSQNDRDFFPLNLRIDWCREGVTETWQYGDRDYRNLGGTVRSLDYYQRDGIINGVHPASKEPSDTFLHPEEEFWSVQHIYQQDGKLDWAIALSQQGVHGALKYAPHLVYNRNLLMAYDGLKYQPGLVSRSGYFLLNDSEGPILDQDGFPCERNTPGTQDLYFFLYKKEYKHVFRDFWLLSGSAPLPDKSTFGLQFCRWPAFNEEEACAIIRQFKDNGIPLSLLILDLEWHTPDFWGWDWNHEFYPDPEAFLKWARSQDVKVMVNVHPKYILSSDSHFKPFVELSNAQNKVKPIPTQFYAMGLVKSDATYCVELNLADKEEAHAYRELCLEPLLEQGVDFLWLDMNSAQLNGADGQILSSKVFYEASERRNQRGKLQSRYGGLGSHRYGVFFTGDTASQWEVLRSECEFTIRAGQAGMAYVSHDIGGFSHEPAPLIDPNLYIRWLQFGVFSPVLRFHSAPGAGSRSPWDYGERNLSIAKHWLQVRLSLMPYIYSSAYQHYNSGIPIIRGLYIEHPHTESCYRWDEYYFGDNLLAAPLLHQSNHRQVYLPEGTWYEFDSSEKFTGGKEFPVYAGLHQVPAYVKAGSILVRYEIDTDCSGSLCKNFYLDVYPAADGGALFYDDDGETLQYQHGVFTLSRFSVIDRGSTIQIIGESVSCGERIKKLILREQRKPKSVTFNGSTIDESRYSFDLQKKCLFLHTESLNFSSPWEICWHFDDCRGE